MRPMCPPVASSSKSQSIYDSNTKISMKNFNYSSSVLAVLGAVGFTVALVGCGGGGGGSTPAKLLPTTTLQGIWIGTVGSDAASAVVLSDGKAWLIANSAPVQLYAATLQGTTTGYSATGKQYTSGSLAAPVAVSFSASPTAQSALSGTVTPTGGLPTAYSFTYQNRYETPALLSDIAGTWSGTQAGSAFVVEWVINSAGVVSEGANNSNGCIYTGNVAVHTVPLPVGDFDLTRRESCTALGATTVKDFAGIVTLNVGKTGATFAFTRSDTGHEGLEGYVQPTIKNIPI
jgi:hypothetical protein